MIILTNYGLRHMQESIKGDLLSRDELRYACGVAPQQVYREDPLAGLRLTRRKAAEARQAEQVFRGRRFGC